MSVIKRTRSFPLVVLAAATVMGCPVNPATGERQLILISEAEEIELGRQVAEQVEAQMGFYDDPDLQEYVNQIGMDLASRSEKPNLPWSFKVVDDVVVNAFALPGGFIFVTRGILAHFNSEAELAGVLGHEIGHVTARHSAEQISRAQMAQLGVGVGAVFVPEIATYGDFINVGLGLLFLKFGRDDERQSDDLGFRYMTRAGYDPSEMVDVFDMLGRVSEAAGGGGIPAWLSTHPDPGERRERMAERLVEAGGSFGGQVGHERYLRVIDGLVFAVNPRNGFFRGSTFLHPDLQFQIEFPAEWRTQNMAHAVAALSPDEDALIQLTLADEDAIDQAADSFFHQEGIQIRSRSSDRINGLPAHAGYFGATTGDGTELRGLAVFIEYKGDIYQILGYTLSGEWSTYAGAFRSSLRSFDRLTDRDALHAQPRRIEIITLDRAMTLSEFAERYPSSVDIATLALINGVGEDDTIAAGESVKRVVGEGLPEE
ncbi:MAG: M48 family metalloprotease [Gemmatimonadota bacterium]|nr:MAG: M48 family metalloprotease [Gemmatimonadota bacterium]